MKQARVNDSHTTGLHHPQHSPQTVHGATMQGQAARPGMPGVDACASDSVHGRLANTGPFAVSETSSIAGLAAMVHLLCTTVTPAVKIQAVHNSNSTKQPHKPALSTQSPKQHRPAPNTSSMLQPSMQK